MAKFYKLITYAEGDNYETREKIITEEAFRQFQDAVINKAEFLVLEDRIIRISSIKEVLPADDEVAEYSRMGVAPEGIQLPEPSNRMLESGNKERKANIKELIKQYHFSFYKQMGWPHKPDCICKQWEKEAQKVN
jgi:hypothetical protein